MIYFPTVLTRISLIPPARLFLIIATIFGGMMILLTPPFQAPDEYVHFYRAYHVSEGHAVALNATLPKSVYDFSRVVSKNLARNPDRKQSRAALVKELRRPFTSQPRVDVNLDSTLVYTPMPYLPQAAGILIGRLLRLPPVLIYYLSRLANLAAWLALTYFAIRIMPVHKRVMFLLALMPMTLFLVASTSADALTIGISFLWIAYILRLALDPAQELTPKVWLVVALLLIPLTLSKSVYVILAGLLLLLPLRSGNKSNPRRWMEYLPVMLMLAAALVLGTVWMNYSSQLVQLAPAHAMAPDSDRLTYILANPLKVAVIFWRSFLMNTPFEMRMFVGVLGWTETNLPDWVYPTYWLALVALALLDGEGCRVSIPAKVLSGLLFLAFFLGMMVSVFIPGISVGNQSIRTIQGRYFIPFGPLMFLPFANQRLRLPATHPIWAVVMLAPILFLVVTLRALLWRFWGK